MNSTKSGRFGFASVPHRGSPAERLMEDNRFDEALAFLEPMLEQKPDDCKLLRLKHHALMGKRQFEAAIKVIESALAIQPHNRVYAKLHAIALKDACHDAAALPLLESLLKETPNDLDILSALCVCHHRLGDQPASLKYGQRKLDLLANIANAPTPASISPDGRRGSKRIVAFSLWGQATQYCRGAVINAHHVPKVLPGWTARFYLAADVPRDVTDAIAEAGAEVISVAGPDSTIPSLMWRFLPHDDPSVDRYISRDSDSRIGEREVAAIDEWLDSGRAFHIMRDHPFHNELIVGGMWGGTAGHSFVMRSEIEEFQRAHGTDSRYGVDQAFLAMRIWPRIGDETCTHDSYYRLGETRPFPGGLRGNDRDHVGMGIVLPD